MRAPTLYLYSANASVVRRSFFLSILTKTPNPLTLRLPTRHDDNESIAQHQSTIEWRYPARVSGDWSVWCRWEGKGEKQRRKRRSITGSMPSSKWIFAANVPSDGPELSIAESLLSLNKVCLGVRRPVTFPLRLYDKDGCLIGLHLWWSHIDFTFRHLHEVWCNVQMQNLRDTIVIFALAS